MKFIINNKNYDKLGFNEKVKILNYGTVKYKNIAEFKKELSNDENYLPLFDIIAKKIRLIFKSRIFNLIKINNFRILNNDLIKFLEDNKFEKKLIDLVKLFDFEILNRNLLNFIFYDSEEIYSDVSYLLNPAFIKYLDISPYLKKSSIINTALNINILSLKDLPIDENKIENIYNKIKFILFTKDILEEHNKIIFNENCNNIIRYYTFLGNVKINNYIRKKTEFYDENTLNLVKKLLKLYEKTKKLEDDKIVFRFVKDDSFLKINDVGDIYVNDSFMSCTRKPNINSYNNEFGFILFKINIPKNSQGYFLSIESNSVFGYEKEILLRPGVKLKLISINEDVEFYLFEEQFLRNIKKKYEFEIVGFEEIKIPTLPKVSIPEIDFNIIASYENLEDSIKNFMKNDFVNKSFILNYDGKQKIIYVDYYDSTSLYSNFFYYKNVNGLFFYSFDKDNNLDLFIEIGDFLILNYPADVLRIKENSDNVKIASIMCNYFKINSMKIFSNYISFIELSNKRDYILETFSINKLLYNILNNKDTEYDIIKYNDIVNFLDSDVDFDKIDFNLIDFYEKNITFRELFFKIVKIDTIYLKYLLNSIPNFIKKCHCEFYPYEFLINNNIITFPPINFSRYFYPNDTLFQETQQIFINKLDKIIK